MRVTVRVCVRVMARARCVVCASVTDYGVSVWVWVGVGGCVYSEIGDLESIERDQLQSGGDALREGCG